MNISAPFVRRPIATSLLAAAVLLSQVLTLFTTPVIYLYMERLAARLRRWRAQASTGPGAGAAGEVP